MLTDLAKEVVSTLALVELSRPSDLLAAAFVESCCEGDTKAQRHRYAITEINAVFDKKYDHSKMTEWINGVSRGDGLISKVPEYIKEHMQWRLLMSITPDDNDESMLALLRLLGIPHELAELHIQNNM